jgi:hypothetical protein
MKIQQHPRMRSILIGDEVYCAGLGLVARVAAVFPAAVCVRLAQIATHKGLELSFMPQLWPADSIESLSVCRHCGCRENLLTDHDTGAPYMICECCRCNLPKTSQQSSQVLPE